MLDAFYNKDVALCDAGVGLGKTYAYLVAVILWMQQRPLALRRPVVISTASVALQDAILKEYIPFISSALIQMDILTSRYRPYFEKERHGSSATCAC